MNRNMEFVRELMLAMQVHPRSAVVIHTRETRVKLNRTLGFEDDYDHNGQFVDAPDGLDEDEVQYHLDIMEEAGLIKPIQSHGLGRLYQLSWEGQEFLDESKQEGVWEAVKVQLGDKLADIPLSVLKALIAQLAIKFATG